MQSGRPWPRAWHLRPREVREPAASRTAFGLPRAPSGMCRTFARTARGASGHEGQRAGSDGASEREGGCTSLVPPALGPRPRRIFPRAKWKNSFVSECLANMPPRCKLILCIRHHVRCLDQVSARPRLVFFRFNVPLLGSGPLRGPPEGQASPVILAAGPRSGCELASRWPLRSADASGRSRFSGPSVLTPCFTEAADERTRLTMLFFLKDRERGESGRMRL